MSNNCIKIILLSILLSGCATEVARTYIPYTPEILNKEAYEADLKLCQDYALKYLKGKEGISGPQIAASGLQAGLGDLGYMVVSPIAPALGGAGGASGEAIRELGLNTQEVKHILAQCLHDKGFKSGAYSTYDPND